MKKIKLITTIFIAMLLIAACGSKTDEDTGSAADVSFDDIYASTEEAMVDILKDESGLSKEELLANYFIEDLAASADNPNVEILLERMELDTDNMANGKVIMPMMNVNSDELILLEAKTKEDVESLKASLELELAAQTQVWEQYLPDQYEKVKNNVIKTNGNFLLYVTSLDQDQIVEAFDKHFK